MSKVYQMRLLDGSALSKEWIEVSESEYNTPLKDPSLWEKRILYTVPPVEVDSEAVIAELRAKLATPKPPEKCPTCNRRYTLESYAHGECAICGDPFDANDALRSMGFTVEGDE